MGRVKKNYDKEYYEDHKEIFRDANIRWKKKNRNSYLESQKKYNRKRKERGE